MNEKFKNYNLELYTKDVKELGLKETWKNICNFLINNKTNNFLTIDNLHNLYELGLALENKNSKKVMGKYYTPEDVSELMSKWFEKLEGEKVCDVACGTGKLILTFLDLIGFENSRKLILSKNLFLYDIDEIALNICKTIIGLKYGFDVIEYINIFIGDFLDEKINLPQNSKVISNPPYNKIKDVKSSWKLTPLLLKSKELYSAFMEKIFSLSKSAVIISPFSFVSGVKFYHLREKMTNLGNGFIFSFDNVPGNIFNGRKQGIFNSNSTNAVRASITIFKNDTFKKGFKISPLIRFKNNQREEVLDLETLNNILPSKHQIINNQNTMFQKIDKTLINIYDKWINSSKYKLKDFISKVKTDYFIDIPNTCRYFTTGSSKKLNRKGSIQLYLKDEKSFNFIYCLINSSFTYWWWRIFDGGITYSINLLKDLPIPFNLLTEKDNHFFKIIKNRMIKEEDKYIIKKLNSGSIQENIKFPQKYRIKINNKILNLLGFNFKEDIFEPVHRNYFKK